MNYKKYYEDYYKCKLSKSWEIHHIDFNHYNNDIYNLVALPSNLHKKLHKAYNHYKLYENYFDLSDIKLHSGKLCNHTLFMEYLKEYINVVEECVPYINNTVIGK